jgi:S-formylglutathione hydrolase FrmB
MIRSGSWRILVVGLLAISGAWAEEARHGTLVTEQLTSSMLEENRIGLDTTRSIKAFLPPGYAESRKSYPVVYFLHNTGWSPDKMFQEGHVVKLLERGFAKQIVKEFIFVVADYTTPTTGSIYENSPVSGRWLDFTVDELVPFIDKRFRTLPHRNSRAVVGDFFGGRGALKLAMTHADVFSVAYALHPVATGNGPSAWTFVQIDWPKIHQAKSFADVGSDGRTQLFVTISQAFLPNLDRPPFYCDFFMEMKDGRPTLHAENTRKTKAGFLLEETLNESAANLRTMRGLAFDWGRFDTTYAHVEANRTFSRLLEDLGVEHEAEEYRGGPWDRLWTEDGRFYARVLPFLARHLVF